MSFISDFIVAIGSTLFVTIFSTIWYQQSKRIENLENEVDQIDNRLRSAISAAEVRQIIDDKLNPLHVQINEVQSDIREIKEILKR